MALGLALVCNRKQTVQSRHNMLLAKSNLLVYHNSFSPSRSCSPPWPVVVLPSASTCWELARAQAAASPRPSGEEKAGGPCRVASVEFLNECPA